MCDYSLHLVQSRPAKVGDNLVSTAFANSLTRGFAAVDAPDVAVCLLPGTEVAFEKEAEYHRGSSFFPRYKQVGKVARFRQLDTDKPDVHHDALEFADGQIVLIHDLRGSQRATVLQMPASPRAIDEMAKRASLVV
jgi:hypothetical protein